MRLARVNMYSNDEILSFILGKTIKSITQDTYTLIFTTTDGFTVKFFHEQDCCESVFIESIDGDLSDLMGVPLLMSEEVSNAPDPSHYKEEFYGSHTWTFYKFATFKGYVTVRWLGESNGWYSESVNIELFVELKDHKEVK